jgi:hypothetical protein
MSTLPRAREILLGPGSQRWSVPGLARPGTQADRTPGWRLVSVSIRHRRRCAQAPK